MSALLLPVALLLAVLAGACFLAGYLWYGHALELHAETLLADDSSGAWLLRHGIAAGFATFGGFLLAFVLYLLDERVGGTSRGPLSALPLESIAVGLFALALGLFVAAGASYVVEAARARDGDGVR